MTTPKTSDTFFSGGYHCSTLEPTPFKAREFFRPKTEKDHGYHSSDYTGAAIDRRFANVAPQFRMGVLSERWFGPAPGNHFDTVCPRLFTVLGQRIPPVIDQARSVTPFNAT
jgi:hypothetical protein